jgi:O-succinylbenzoate synthase
VKILVHHYTLHPGSDPARAARTCRHGALLKVEFDNGTTGHADLHPWEEFGHSPLSAHLASLKTGSPTPLASLALRHARTDAAARKAGVSLFEGLPEVRSHALFTDWTRAPRSAFEQCVAEGYTAAKLKIGKNPEHEAAALNRLAGLPLRWRFDANAAFTTGGEPIDHFLATLPQSLRQKLEFLEDPLPYDPGTWSALSSDAKLPLALDWELPDKPPPWPGAQILVIKPASQDAFPLALAVAHAGMELVVSHSMDHPLGQSVALWTAMRLRQRHGDLVRDGGLQAAGLYQPDNFTAQLQTAGPRTIPPPGTGFGFDEPLAELPWARFP